MMMFLSKHLQTVLCVKLVSVESSRKLFQDGCLATLPSAFSKHLRLWKCKVICVPDFEKDAFSFHGDSLTTWSLILKKMFLFGF